MTNVANNTSSQINAFTEETAPVYRTYKDRVFRLLFNDKKRLLTLYNALNDTSYTNAEDLTVNTLENAIFMKMKNDVSFIIDCDMCLYEHQSTYCPNMPLRGFLYFADLFKIHIKDADLSVPKRIMIPVPKYIVFYNGTERKEEEFTQKLSDSFEEKQEGCIELTVRTININYGHNRELMEKCKPLADYSYFIATIRKKPETKSLQNAVEESVETCIKQNILKDFLSEQKAEVIAMSIYEYNEDYVKKTLYEEGYDAGKNEGQSEAILKNVESVMQNLHIDLEHACKILNINVEDYTKAKILQSANTK
ncbi:MAG: hypothetical protein ACI4C4_00675 [Lachnospiraceae bacterium]